MKVVEKRKSLVYVWEVKGVLGWEVIFIFCIKSKIDEFGSCFKNNRKRIKYLLWVLKRVSQKINSDQVLFDIQVRLQINYLL